MNVYIQPNIFVSIIKFPAIVGAKQHYQHAWKASGCEIPLTNSSSVAHVNSSSSATSGTSYLLLIASCCCASQEESVHLVLLKKNYSSYSKVRFISHSYLQLQYCTEADFTTGMVMSDVVRVLFTASP